MSDEDIWKRPIQEYVSDRARVSTQEVLAHAVGIGFGAQTFQQRKRVTAIMRELGWSYRHDKFWRRP